MFLYHHYCVTPRDYLAFHPFNQVQSSSIKVTYQLNDEDAIYPMAQVCFSRLTLPVVHKSQQSFNDAFVKALEFGGGYGNI